jgi:hypothetical protein
MPRLRDGFHRDLSDKSIVHGDDNRAAVHERRLG